MRYLIALTVLAALTTSAYADADPNFPGAVERGTNQVGFSTIPFVSDRTYKRVMGRNFQSGPFHELGPKDKVAR